MDLFGSPAGSVGSGFDSDNVDMWLENSTLKQRVGELEAEVVSARRSAALLETEAANASAAANKTRNLAEREREAAGKRLKEVEARLSAAAEEGAAAAAEVAKLRVHAAEVKKRQHQVREAEVGIQNNAIVLQVFFSTRHPPHVNTLVY
jgi:hypothetical protein